MKRRIVLGTLLTVAVITGASLAGCGGDDDDDGGAGDITPAASTQPAAATEPAVGSTQQPAGNATEPAGDGVENLTVTAADFSFDADLTSVAAGSVVQVAFSNSGSSPHTLTFYTDAEHTDAIPGGDSERVPGGDSVIFTFEAPESGSAFYRCEVHPSQMEGELTID